MATTVNTLPNELLFSCFSHLREDKAAIRSLRLVSKRFCEAASPLLVTKIKIHFTSQSFRDLEELAAHHSFSKGIHTVHFGASYYDKILANSIRRFAEHYRTEIDQEVDIMSRYRDPPPELFQIAEEFGDVNTDSFNPTKATDYQRTLIRAHASYKTLYTDQQNVMDNGGWVTRLTSAFANFPKLRELILTDDIRAPPEVKRRGWSDAVGIKDGLYHRCLFPNHWKGSFRTAIDTEPPAHLIHQLFMGLADTSIRLKSFDIRLTAPFDLRYMSMSDAQLDAVRKAVSRAEAMFIRISNWARRGSLAENNDRPRDEMLCLSRFTSACYSSPRLTNLQLSLDSYPAFYEHPTVSLADFLPLPLPCASNLTDLYLRNVPFTNEELGPFKDTFQAKNEGKLRWLVLYAPYLLSGDWIKTLDILRDLRPTEHVELQYPKGGVFSTEYTLNSPKHTAYEQYIMRESDENPLIGFVPEF